MNILNNIEFNYTYEGLEIEDGWEHNAYTVEIIKEELKKPELTTVIQCVFNRIEKDWIIKTN